MPVHEYFPVQCLATVFPAPSSEFNARQDAEALREAMKGFRCDEQVIIDVLTTKGIVQRLQIAEAFKTMYGKDLGEAFEKKLSRDFKNLAVALVTPLADFYAKELHWAISGMGTCEKTLIEILCTLSNAGIRYVSEAYERLYKTTLEQALKDGTSFHFKRFLVSLCQGNREEKGALNMQQASQDAQDLIEAGVARWGTDETVFNAVMATRSYPHLSEVFKYYYKYTGHDIVDAIKGEFSGAIRDAHLTIVECVRGKTAYYAKRLHWSMKGLGTNERTLIRIIVGRSEIDLGDIKSKFEGEYEGTLEDWIKGDTSGAFQRALLRLIGTD